MIDLELAKSEFEAYLTQFNMADDKLKLKKVHTYHTMKLVKYIADHEKLSEEDFQLATLIALLHDIGRFKQYEIIQSYDDSKVSHATLSIEYLFDQNHIQDFIKVRYFDQIIKMAILYHSQYQIPQNLSDKELLHCKIIRDVDKLDNFRVKNDESVETLLDISKEELGETFLSDYIFDQVMNSQLIKSEYRRTKMDIWVSWTAFLFDLNFKSSYQYLLDYHLVEKNIDRIEYTNINTRKKMALIKQHCIRYMTSKIHCPYL